MRQTAIPFPWDLAVRCRRAGGRASLWCKPPPRSLRVSTKPSARTALRLETLPSAHETRRQQLQQSSRSGRSRGGDSLHRRPALLCSEPSCSCEREKGQGLWLASRRSQKPFRFAFSSTRTSMQTAGSAFCAAKRRGRSDPRTPGFRGVKWHVRPSWRWTSVWSSSWRAHKRPPIQLTPHPPPILTCGRLPLGPTPLSSPSLAPLSLAFPATASMGDFKLSAQLLGHEDDVSPPPYQCHYAAPLLN